MEENTINITDSDIESIINGDNIDVEESNDEEVTESTATPTDSASSNRFDNDIKKLNIMDEFRDEQYLRFKGAGWFDSFLYKNLAIIGAGGISSWATLILSRLRFMKIEVYDGGVVEVKNMSGQMFTRGDIGKQKAYAVADNVRLFNWDDVCIYGSVYNFDRRSPYDSYDIVVCGVDSMRSRRRIFDSFKGTNVFFVDGRLAADFLQIFAFDMNDTDAVNKYEEMFLFDDSEADETPCSFKQTTYMASMIGSLIGNIVVNRVNNMKSVFEYNVPFYTEFNPIMMRMKTLTCYDCK